MGTEQVQQFASADRRMLAGAFRTTGIVFANADTADTSKSVVSVRFRQRQRRGTRSSAVERLRHVGGFDAKRCAEVAVAIILRQECSDRPFNPA